MLPRWLNIITKTTVTDEIKQSVKNNRFILTTVILSVILYTILFSPETVSPDGSGYMILGKQLIQGEYHSTFFHRMPFLPTVFALLYITGIPIITIRFLVPLFFIVLSLVSTFLLMKEIANEKIAELSTVLLFCFPQFWRWGTKFLTDIPLISFTALFFYFLLRGLKNNRYFIYAGVILGLGMITKVSFLLLPPVVFFYLLLKHRNIFRKREIWAGVMISAMIISVAFFTVSHMTTLNSFEQLETIANTSERLTPFVQIVTGEYTSVLYILKLAFYPLLLFLPFGLKKSLDGEIKILTLFGVALILLLFFFWVVRLRYFSPVYPLIVLLIAEGYMFLRTRTNKNLVDTIFTILVIVSVLNVFYIVSLDHESLWGAETISKRVSLLEEPVLTSYLPAYINLTSDIITQPEIVEKFSEGTISLEKIKESGARYVIISIYDEWERMPDKDAFFQPKYAMINLPFKRTYSNGRVPPDFTFRSKLYKTMESEGSFIRADEIYKNGQLIFIIYKRQ